MRTRNRVIQVGGDLFAEELVARWEIEPEAGDRTDCRGAGLERFSVFGDPGEEFESGFAAQFDKPVDAAYADDLAEGRAVDVALEDFERTFEAQFSDAAAGFCFDEPRLVAFRDGGEGIEDLLVSAELPEGGDDGALRLQVAHAKAAEEGIAGRVVRTSRRLGRGGLAGPERRP